MGSFYHISELSSLFDICSDTIRHYEKLGLVTPTRGRNNYRVYSISDICNLNIIRNLRSLGVSLEDISDYVKHRNVDSTLSLLQEEEQIIQRRILQLQEQQQEVSRRMTRIREYRARTVDEFQLRELPSRPCYLLQEDVIEDYEINFMLKKLESKYEEILHIIGSQQIGAILDTDSMRRGIYNRYASALIITEEMDRYNAMLPGGLYASLVYGGVYEKLSETVVRLTELIRRAGLRPVAAPIELYQIDEHDTNRPEEYRTEVQVLVERV